MVARPRLPKHGSGLLRRDASHGIGLVAQDHKRGKAGRNAADVKSDTSHESPLYCSI
jgi:hypothetical protein